ncbi:placenta-specific protein 9-like [Paramormyrops kingsleyae]|uniref:placenta-specific protein 9-like n=1 Tax=Paramormyrops kingsleyae TaxID=1676925 RepID=UPI003B96BBA4
MGQSAASLTLLLTLSLVLLGQANTGPQAVPITACKNHAALHSRLGDVEKRVEDTVRQLEADMQDLLGVIEAPEWKLVFDAGDPTIDILDGRDTSSSV